jgi:peptide/nickel transport system substrate-binding protein
MAERQEDERNPLERRISRRAMIGGTLKAGGAFAVLGGAGGLLAACGGGEEAAAPPAATTAEATTTAATTAPAATTAAPATGGTLLYGSASVVEKIGTQVWGGPPFTTGYALFDRLTRLTADGKDVEPSLATEIQASDDGLTYTFPLQQGVTFHDGSPLTAADVKYSIERQLNPENAMEAQSLFVGLGIAGATAYIDGTATETTGIRVVDDNTVAFDLDAPNGSLPYVMSLTMASIVPAAYIEDIGSDAFETAPVGTGPFKLRFYEAGRGMAFDRYPDYWDTARAAKLDAVEWEFNIDPSLAVLRLESGELDLFDDPLLPGDYIKVRDDPAQVENLKVGTENNVLYLTLSVENEYTKDVKVRRAFSHAIDREKVVRSLAGVGEVANGGLFSPLSPYFQEGLTPQYDPDAATALLAEAGLPDGFPITIYCAQIEPHQTIAKNAQADLAQVGIDAEIKFNPSAGAAYEEWLADTTQIWVSQWELPYPHGSYVIDSGFTEAALNSGCCNFSSWVDPRLEELALTARTTTSTEESIQAYKDIDALVIGEEVLWVPIIYPARAFLKSTRVQGYEVPATPQANTKFFAEYTLAA